jgi:HrpA-like RNA helicase
MTEAASSTPAEALQAPPKVEKTQLIRPDFKREGGFFKKEPDIRQGVKDHLNMVTTGATGTGKSAIFPLLYLEALGPGTRIAITEPRKANVDNVNNDISENSGDPDLIDFQYKNHPLTKPHSRINAFVEASLLNKIKNDPLLMDYDAVLVDEVHEQGKKAVVLLAQLRKVQAARMKEGKKPLRIVTISATVNTEQFKNYLGDAAIIDAEGEKRFKTDVKYADSTDFFDPPITKEIRRNDIPKYTAQAIETILKKKGQGDIIVFVPGGGDIAKGQEELKLKLKELGLPEDSLDIRSLYSGTSEKDRTEILHKTVSKQRVIFATSAAETGITIKNLGWVINSGWGKQNELDEATGLQFLNLEKSSRSIDKQREGRVGRNADGTVIHLMTKEEFEAKPQYPTPEISRTELLDVVLDYKNLGNDSMEFVSDPPPSAEEIKRSEMALKILGALDENGKITDIGKQMASMAGDGPNTARMMIEAAKTGDSKDKAAAITVAAFIGLKDSNTLALDVTKPLPDTLLNKDSDFVTMLNIYAEYQKVKHDSGAALAWANANNVNLAAIRGIENQRDELAKDLKEPQEYDGDFNADVIQKAVVVGFADKLLTYQPANGLYRLRNGLVAPGEGSAIRQTSGNTEQIVGVRFKRDYKTKMMGMFAGQKVYPEWIEHLEPLYKEAGIELKKGLIDSQAQPESVVAEQQNYSHIPQEVLEDNHEAPKPIKKDIEEAVATHKDGKKPKPGVLKRIANFIKSLFIGGKKTSYP